jgi:hypothetical protein
MRTMQVTRYICDDCHKAYDTGDEARACELFHQRQMPLPGIPLSKSQEKHWSHTMKAQETEAWKHLGGDKA